MATFGRLLLGQADQLLRFEPSLSKIEDPRQAAVSGRTHHDNATFNGRKDSAVAGMVFEVTDGELVSADAYEETASYKRIAVVLASGRDAWVYVDGRTAPW